MLVPVTHPGMSIWCELMEPEDGYLIQYPWQTHAHTHVF